MSSLIGMRVATATLPRVLRMEALAEEARRRARAIGRPVLVSVTTEVKLRDPLALFARGAGVTHNRLFWNMPASGGALVGLGDAWSYEAQGAARFADSAAAWRDLMQHAVIDRGPDLPLGGPIAAAGFSFDPLRLPTSLWGGYPAGLLLLPRLTLAQAGDRCSLTLNGMVGPDSSAIGLSLAAARRIRDLIGGPWRPRRPASDPAASEALPAEEWQRMVASAVADLRAGQMEKVVLARRVNLRAAAPIDTAVALENLRRDYPDTFVFAVARGGRTFLGASPERLVSLRQGQVAASGLAGTIARGATPAEDDRLGQALLGSAKDRNEHAIVVRMIAAALAEVCADVIAPAQPTLMKVRNLQHLFTPITGRIAGDRSILDLVERLHPTPALGGQPRQQALAWIRDHEQLDRGWYGAPVGWVDARGEGEFAVAIRSALVGESEAALFAGCGIVADSDPAREYQESQIKLRAMLGALGIDQGR